MEHFRLKGTHQDVLEEKYRPIHADIVRQNDEFREVHLVDDLGISRTYALTFFSKNVDYTGELKSIDDTIKSGGSIGKTFGEHGYSIEKNVLLVDIVKLPEDIMQRFGMPNKFAKARISEFYAKNETCNPIIYGTVLEIYSPDFRDAKINAEDTFQINPTTNQLEKCGFSKHNIWEKIGDGNIWINGKDRYIKAKIKSYDEVIELVRKIEGISNVKFVKDDYSNLVKYNK